MFVHYPGIHILLNIWYKVVVIVSAKGHIVLEEGLTYTTMFFSQHCVIRHACVDLNRWLQAKGSTVITELDLSEKVL